MNHGSDVVTYLNRPRDPRAPFYSKLHREIALSKQARAPAAQWIAMIRAFTQKGVKQLEIEETGILARLEAVEPSLVIEREVIAAYAQEGHATVKQVTLGKPKWGAWRWPGGDYFETLFILNSQRDDVVDRIEAIEYELEQINFDMDRLLEAIPLDDERRRLKAMVNDVADFSSHHFSDAIEGRHGKNLLAHARYTLRDNTFFIEEIQSDWAQKGRRAEWRGVPKGPYVTSTDLWTGLVLRRLMQMAARLPSVTQIAWITGDMRNGRKGMSRDNLGDFYEKIIPKICEKTIGKLGRVAPREVVLGGQSEQVLGVDYGPELREKLANEMPLYSHGPLCLVDTQDEEVLSGRREFLLARFEGMLGSVATLHLVTDMLGRDGAESPTGSYLDGLVTASLAAQHVEEVLSHESFHAAWDRLLYVGEKELLAQAFDSKTRLSKEVVAAVAARYGDAAAGSCRSSVQERCAYAFQLWAHGHLALTASALELFAPARGIFGRIKQALLDLWQFVCGERAAGRNTAEKIFSGLNEGLLAHERAVADQGCHAVFAPPGGG
jgi:hypothetical protein